MRKLFYEDINITDFTATVTACEPIDAGKTYRVLLDATAFFPEEGGQSADMAYGICRIGRGCSLRRPVLYDNAYN